MTQTNNEEKEQQINRNYDDFTNSLIPFGSLDIRTMVGWALEAGKDGSWCAEQIQEFIDSTGTKLENIDCCYVILDTILQESRNEIIEATGKDILNDLKECVETYGNYMCSSYDGTETAVKDTLKLIKKVKDKSDVLKFFEEQLKSMY